MLTHKNIKSAAEAVDYYSKCQVIYSDGTKEVISGWYGKGAKNLGLEGNIDMDKFRDILDGKIDYNGQHIELGVKNNNFDKLIHAPGTDFTFNVPKSVSNQASMEGGDKRIHDTLLEAAKQTVDYIEKNYVYTRVKINGKVFKEQVDNVVSAYFLENLNRDNEFHSHVHFVFANMVQKKNGDWRSAEFKAIVENEIFLGKVFRTNLAYGLQKLGYQVEFTDKEQHFFQIKGSNKEFDEFTSQRTQKIIDKALEINPNSRPNSKIKQIANLLTRQSKKLSSGELVKLTDFRIKEFFNKTKVNIVDNIKELTRRAVESSMSGKEPLESKKIAREAIGNAIEHCSERKSVFSEKDIIEHAMPIVGGRANLNIMQNEIERFLKRKVLIIDQKNYTRGEFGSVVDENSGKSKTEFQSSTSFTTRHAMEREKSTIELMNKGQGSYKAVLTKKRADELLGSLNDKLTETTKLNEGQLEAAKAILTSKDIVHGIQGYAGTGKTYMLSKVQEILDQVNKEKLAKNPSHIPYQLQGLAPSGAAVKELQKVGIKSQTLQSITAQYAGYAEGRGTKQGAKDESQKFINKIFVIDESSMIDAKDMQDFMVISSKLGIKSTLIGDIRQLPSVGAGRPVYEMQRQGMPVVKMTEIRRQQNQIGKAIAYSAYARDFRGIFEKVGNNLVDCSILKGVEQKDLGKGAVVTDIDIALSAAKLYFSFDQEKREETLIVAQSNDTKNLVNEFVREVLIEKKQLSNVLEERKILVNENPTIAQRELSSTYYKGQVILFNKANKTLGISKNEYFEIKGVSDKNLKLQSLDSLDNRIDFNIKASKSYRKHIELYRTEDREFRVGDKVMFTRKIEDNSIEDIKDLIKSDEVKKETDIVNSTLGVVEGIEKEHYIIHIGENKLKINKNSPALRHIDYSYCRTTHKAQGATEKTSILITESWYKHLTEERNFLVQATRHKEDVYMIIDNKESVIQRILENKDKNNDSSIDFLSSNSSLLQRIELSQSLFKSLGGNEEYNKYKIALEYGKNFNIHKEFKGLPEENIDPKLTLSGNIANKISALDLILRQDDKEIVSAEKNILKRREGETEIIYSNHKNPVTSSSKNQPEFIKHEIDKAAHKKLMDDLFQEFSSEEIQKEFRWAIYESFKDSDFTGIHSAVERAFFNIGEKQYFGKKNQVGVTWYDTVGYVKDYEMGGKSLKWDIGNMKQLSRDETGYIKKDYKREKQERKFSRKPKYLVPEFSTDQIQAKFKEAIHENLKDADFTGLDEAIDRAFSNLGEKQYFGKKKKGELKWHGKAGYAKDYKIGGEPLKWGIGSIKLSSAEKESLSFKKVSKEDMEKERKKQELRAAQLEIKKKEAREQLSEKANKIYSSLPEINRNTINNKYLSKKGLSEYIHNADIKFNNKGDIIIPVKDIDGKIWTLQTIEDSGQKRKMFLKAFMEGAGAKLGNFFFLNNQNLKSDKIKNIILTEGFATAASIDKAINSKLAKDKKIPIAVCFDAGNLGESLKNIKSKYPNHDYIIAADDDSIKGKGNTGGESAIKAAQKYGARVISPKFSHLSHKDNLSTDFNDLHMVEGIEKVEKQFADISNYKVYKKSVDFGENKHTQFNMGNSKTDIHHGKTPNFTLENQIEFNK